MPGSHKEKDELSQFHPVYEEPTGTCLIAPERNNPANGWVHCPVVGWPRTRCAIWLVFGPAKRRLYESERTQSYNSGTERN